MQFDKKPPPYSEEEATFLAPQQLEIERPVENQSISARIRSVDPRTLLLIFAICVFFVEFLPILSYLPLLFVVEQKIVMLCVALFTISIDAFFFYGAITQKRAVLVVNKIIAFVFVVMCSMSVGVHLSTVLIMAFTQRDMDLGTVKFGGKLEELFGVQTLHLYLKTSVQVAVYLCLTLYAVCGLILFHLRYYLLKKAIAAIDSDRHVSSGAQTC